MGMYTSIHDAEGVEHQIKCGDDYCERFNIGDEVPAHPDLGSPLEGYLLDDVYDAYSDVCETWTWVIIKDRKIHAVVTRTEDPLAPGTLLDRDIDYAFLYQKYEIKALPHDTWADEDWANVAKAAAEEEQRKWQWVAECVGLTQEEISAKTCAGYMVRKMQEESLFRKIMPPLPVDEE